MDMLCVLGRGIEKVKTSSGYIWRPTRYIERLADNGWHSGFRSLDITPDDEDQRVVIAGSNANVLAAAELFQKSASAGRPPKIVAFTAGRPKYITNDPDPSLSEGRVLREKFLSKVHVSSETEVIVRANGQTTRGEVLEILHLAKSLGLGSIGVITVSLHIPRTKEFLRLALEKDRSLGDLEIIFLSSEEILFNRHRRYADILKPAMNSKTYERTRAKERKGLDDLRSGRYNFGHHGCGGVAGEKE